MSSSSANKDASLDLKASKPMTYTAVTQSLLNSFEVHGTDFREAKLVDKGVRHTTWFSSQSFGQRQFWRMYWFFSFFDYVSVDIANFANLQIVVQKEKENKSQDR